MVTNYSHWGGGEDEGCGTALQATKRRAAPPPTKPPHGRAFCKGQPLCWIRRSCGVYGGCLTHPETVATSSAQSLHTHMCTHVQCARKPPARCAQYHGHTTTRATNDSSREKGREAEFHPLPLMDAHFRVSTAHGPRPTAHCSTHNGRQSVGKGTYPTRASAREWPCPPACHTWSPWTRRVVSDKS